MILLLLNHARFEIFNGTWCPIRSRNFLPLASAPGFLLGSVLLICLGLCCPIMRLYVLSSVLDARYDFHIKTMFGSSLPPVVCRNRGLMSYLRYLCLFAYSGVQHIILCLCLFSFVFLRLVVLV
jgi:hypothetical protein